MRSTLRQRLWRGASVATRPKPRLGEEAWLNPPGAAEAELMRRTLTNL